jgi:hypothetical protein
MINMIIHEVHTKDELRCMISSKSLSTYNNINDD